MQKLFLMALTAILMLSCGNNTQNTSADTQADEPQGPDLSHLVGLYNGGTWHSQGFVVIIAEQDGQLTAKGSQTEGGEPDMAFIEEYPDEFKFVNFTTFELDADLKTFNSDWGTGQFVADEYGAHMVFNSLPGAYDPAEDKENVRVRLTKVIDEE